MTGMTTTPPPKPVNAPMRPAKIENKNKSAENNNMVKIYPKNKNYSVHDKILLVHPEEARFLRRLEG
jgi:hypothetical protein